MFSSVPVLLPHSVLLLLSVLFSSVELVEVALLSVELVEVAFKSVELEEAALVSVELVEVISSDSASIFYKICKTNFDTKEAPYSSVTVMVMVLKPTSLLVARVPSNLSSIRFASIDK